MNCENCQRPLRFIEFGSKRVMVQRHVIVSWDDPDLGFERGPDKYFCDYTCVENWRAQQTVVPLFPNDKR